MRRERRTLSWTRLLLGFFEDFENPNVVRLLRRRCLRFEFEKAIYPLAFQTILVEVLYQWVESLVLRQDDAMQTRRFLDDSPEMTGNVKIQGVASVSLYSLPVNTAAKFLGGGNQFDRHAFLTGTDEDDDMKMLVKSMKVDLLNILEINKKKFMSQFATFLGFRFGKHPVIVSS